nr:uncharacterized protein LOC113821750 [Penaeus vannamei]
MATSPPGPQPHLGSIQQHLHAQLAHASPNAPRPPSTPRSCRSSTPTRCSSPPLQSALSKVQDGRPPLQVAPAGAQLLAAAHGLPPRSSSPSHLHCPSRAPGASPRRPAGGAGLVGGGFEASASGARPGGPGSGGGLGGSGLGGGGLAGPGLGPGGLGSSGLGGGGALLGSGALNMSSSSPNPSGGLGALDGLVGGSAGASGRREPWGRQWRGARRRRARRARGAATQGSLTRRPRPTWTPARRCGDAPEAKARDDGFDAGDTQSSTSSNGGGGTKRRGRASGDGVKDEAYWERRRKNNEAAKRSRDARRAKEDEIAIRAAFLEQENLKLRVEVASLKSETAKLRCMLYNS